MNNNVYTKGVRRLVSEDFYFEDEIDICKGCLNFYLVFYCNVDQVFGTQVETEANDYYINVYDNLELATGEVCDNLDITLVKITTDEYLKYALSTEEKNILRKKMDRYLKDNGWLGLTLPSVTIAFQPEYGTVVIGSENSSGCKYQDVFTIEKLKTAVESYIQNNLKL